MQPRPGVECPERGSRTRIGGTRRLPVATGAVRARRTHAGRTRSWVRVQGEHPLPQLIVVVAWMDVALVNPRLWPDPSAGWPDLSPSWPNLSPSGPLRPPRSWTATRAGALGLPLPRHLRYPPPLLSLFVLFRLSFPLVHSQYLLVRLHSSPSPRPLPTSVPFPLRFWGIRVQSC